MLQPKATIIIVTWNSLHYIGDCLRSVSFQDFQNYSVIIVDNASRDNTVDYVRFHYPRFSILQNFKNLGFAKAFNQGVKIAQSPYIISINPDIILERDFFSKIISFVESRPQAGSVCGKLLKMSTKDIDPAEPEGALREAVRSNIIDSAGLIIFKNRHVSNRGEGEKDNESYNITKEIFGVGAACALYCSEALENIKIKDEYMDQDFFSYKEDVDLAWRLRHYGWESWYIPSAVAYHYRGFSKAESHSLRETIRLRKSVSGNLRYYSLRNHHLMLLKNESLINLFYHIIPFFIREMKIFLYSIIFEPSVFFRSLMGYIRLFTSTFLKRKVIMAHSRVSPHDMRKWFK